MGLFDLFQKKHYKAGEILRFGRYYFESEQDVRPIEWIVLASEQGELLMISKYCLDVVHYYDQALAPTPAWEGSYLRRWLNGEFFGRAFTEKEKRQILETVIVTDEASAKEARENRLFLLSEPQIRQYLPDSRGFPTPYARARGAGAGCDTGKEAVWWWTMPAAQGCPAWEYFGPGVVSADGEVLYHSRLFASPGSFHATVRPAIRIRK